MQSAGTASSPSAESAREEPKRDQAREHARRAGERGQVVVGGGEAVAGGERACPPSRRAGDHGLEQHGGGVAGALRPPASALVEHARDDLLERVAEDDVLDERDVGRGRPLRLPALAHAGERVELARLLGGAAAARARRLPSCLPT